ATAASHHWKRAQAASSGTGSTGAATASSTPRSTGSRSRRPAITPPPAPTSNANEPKARAGERRSAASNASSSASSSPGGNGWRPLTPTVVGGTLAGMAGLPSGTVTLLFSDIEGSTGLLRRLGPAYEALLTEHRGLLRVAFAEAGGEEVETRGDSFLVAFGSARAAVEGAVAGQRALAAHTWPDGVQPRARMG